MKILAIFLSIAAIAVFSLINQTNMTNDNSLELIIGWIAASVISLVILYYIIRSAAGTAKREKQLQLQNQILLHIGKKLGVDQEHLDNMQKDNLK